MNRHTLQCGAAIALGLVASVLSLSSAQTPVLPQIQLAEKAVTQLPDDSSVTPPAELRLAPAVSTPTTVAAPAPKPVGVPRTAAPKVPSSTQVTYKQAVSRTVSYTVRSTAYNSLPGQTDGDPHITATGTRTRFGVVALSRDLLGRIPYGSRIRITDLSGSSSYNRMLSNTVFIVEDTMNARIRGRVDVWMSSYSQAMSWGNRPVKITVLN